MPGMPFTCFGCHNTETLLFKLLLGGKKSASVRDTCTKGTYSDRLHFSVGLSYGFQQTQRSVIRKNEWLSTALCSLPIPKSRLWEKMPCSSLLVTVNWGMLASIVSSFCCCHKDDTGMLASLFYSLLKVKAVGSYFLQWMFYTSGHWRHKCAIECFCSVSPRAARTGTRWHFSSVIIGLGGV